MRSIIIRCQQLMLLLIMVSCLAAGFAMAEEGDSEDVILFKWGFIHRTQDGAERILDFKTSPKIATGESLQIYIQSIKNVFVYLYLYDSSKDLFLVYPESTDFYDKKESHLSREYHIPAKDKWFDTDAHPGTEKFILLASNKRLATLENMTEKFLRDDSNAELKFSLLEEIQKTRQKYSNFTKIAEKGVPIAGTMLKRDKKIIGEATLVEADTFYSKTLRLKHE